MRISQIEALLQSDGANITLEMKLADLKQLFRELWSEFEAKKPQPDDFRTVSRSEAAKMLGVSEPTLCKWHKNGMLKAVKVGARAVYRVSDIKAMLASPNHK